MHPQMCPLIESFIANLDCVRRFSAVNKYVLLETLKNAEPFSTTCASVWFLAGVSPQMVDQCRFVCDFFMAKFTFMTFFGRVDSSVISQFAFRSKFLVTKIASVCFLFRDSVDSSVTCQVAFRSNFLVTNIASVCFLFLVVSLLRPL